jgi:hypothetical protein
MMLDAHLFGLPNAPKQVWSQHLAVVGALLLSQYNVVWIRFLQATCSGYQSFDSPWCFISAECGTGVSARFLIHGAHAVCFCILVAILDQPILYSRVVFRNIFKPLF